jgi:hypothetical protein
MFDWVVGLLAHNPIFQSRGRALSVTLNTSSDVSWYAMEHWGQIHSALHRNSPLVLELSSFTAIEFVVLYVNCDPASSDGRAPSENLPLKHISRMSQAFPGVSGQAMVL